jgi:glycosyltransferase involved in cell wall biosynthesis
MSIIRFGVSVVIPYYNRSNSIKKTLKSVVNQTIEDWEIIIIDDGSETFESKALYKIVSEFNDSRITVILEEKNKGGGHARNVGTLAAKGEYIAFLDSDDEWAPNKLELQLNLHRNEDVKLISYTKSIIKYGTDSSKQDPIPKIAISPVDKISDYLFVKGGFMPTPSLFGSTRVLQKCLFDTSLRRHQDYDLLLTLESYGCSFKMLNEVLVTIHWEDVGTNAGTRFYCPDVSSQFVKDRKSQFSKRAEAAFRLNNVFAPIREREGIKPSLYKEFFADLYRVKLIRVQLFTLTILIFGSIKPLKYPLKIYKKLFR